MAGLRARLICTPHTMNTRTSIRAYEEYRDRAEKRKAQQGARRGMPTGRARGYVFVFGQTGDAVGSVIELSPGSTNTGMLASTGVSLDYLRGHCRRVAKRHLPPEWAGCAKRFED